MNDFDYDVMQKKRIASGARHRVNGSKTTYCGLPSDRLTPAQWRKKNGEVKTVFLNRPMSWKEFRNLAKDLQEEYIQKTVATFGCSMVDFAKIFGVHVATVQSYFKEQGLGNGLFTKGNRIGSRRTAFVEWLNGSEQEERPADCEAEQDVAKEEKQSAPAVLANCNRMELSYSGEFDYLGIVQAIHQFSKDRPVKLTIIMESEGLV